MGEREEEWLLTGPAYINLDASIVKIVRLGAARHAEFRADFFNLPNTAHYNNPSGSYGSGNFGRITSVIGQSNRLIRFGVRVMF